MYQASISLYFDFESHKKRTRSPNCLRMVRLKMHETILSDNMLFACNMSRALPAYNPPTTCCFASLGVEAIIDV